MTEEVLQRVKARRKELRLSQTAVAKCMGVTQPAYRAIEEGVTKLTLDALTNIAGCLETSVKTLMGFDDDKAETIYVLPPESVDEISERLNANMEERLRQMLGKSTERLDSGKGTKE